MLDCNKKEIEIIKLIMSWDIDAYYCIVENYQNKLLKYILRITDIDLEEAENLLQEVFIKAYKNINDYDEKYNFSSWIYKIAHNITIDFYRKNKDKLLISLETKDNDYKNLIDILESPENIEKKYKTKELILKIRDILSKLDFKYREVLILKFIDWKNYDEISDIIKSPTWTVATLINRAKKQFKIIANENKLITYI